MKSKKKPKTVKRKKTKERTKKNKIPEVLTEREEHLRDIVALSGEVYWEQDKDFRYTLVMHGDAQIQKELSDLYLGTRSWDHNAVPINFTWARHKKNLRARKTFKDLLQKQRAANGVMRYYSMSAKPVFTKNGKFAGYRGLTVDVTQKARQERLSELEKNILHILSDATDIEESLQSAICIICSSEGWEAGNYWKLNETEDVLCFDTGWNIPERESANWIREQAEAVTFKRGEGLPGWVWVAGEPLWVPDVMKDPRITVTNVTDATGWKAIFLFPVTSEGKVIGVLDFYAPEIAEPDTGLLQVIGILGAEIGHFYQRAVTLKELERYSETFELAAVGIAYVGPGGKFVIVNQRLCDMLGYTRDELLKRTIHELSHPDDRHVTDEVRRQLWAGEIDSFKVEKRYLHKDGSTVWTNVTSTVKHGESGEPLYAISMLEDISARKQIEQELKESELRFRSLTELSSDWYWEQDAEFRFVRFEGRNKDFIAQLETAFIGKHSWEIDVRIADEDNPKSMKEIMEAHEPFRDIVMYGVSADGSKRYSSVSGEPVFDAEGRFKGYRGLSRDVTAAKEAETRIEYLATHDALTDLPNRAMFNRILGMTIAASERYKRKFAVLFIDLDGFKTINDTLGHDAGDTVLRDTAKRLLACVRSSDVVARLAGDEFTVLVHEINNKQNAGVVAENILSAISEPMVYSGKNFKLTASVGVSLYPDDAMTGQSLVNNADKAMYVVKNTGRNNFHFHEKTN